MTATCNPRDSDSPSQELEGELLEQTKEVTEVVNEDSTTCRTEISLVTLPCSTIKIEVRSGDKILSEHDDFVPKSVKSSENYDKINLIDVYEQEHETCKTVTKYICNLFFQEFSKSIDLTDHILEHLGSTSFDCNVCGEDLQFLELLDKHFSEKHWPALLIS